MIELEVKQLVKRFGKKTILNQLSFSQKGGVLGIAGKNGSGKSTLLRCLSFLLSPDAGEILWLQDDKAIQKQNFKKTLGYAAPYLNLYAEFSSVENIAFHAELKNKSITEEILKEFAELLDVRFSLHQPFSALSSGQQQRVKLLSAFSLDNQIIFLDEPGTNLDESGISCLSKIIQKSRDEKKLILIASNDRTELNWCDKVISIDDKILA